MQVAIVHGSDRKQIIRKTLELIKPQTSKQIVVKPNFVSTTNQLAATHVEHVEAIIQYFFDNNYNKKIIIAESAALGETWDGFRNFGYIELAKKYDIELMDLQDDDHSELKLQDGTRVKIASTLLDKNNYIISAAKLKTHDTVIMTGALKNILVGAIISDKSAIHQGIPEINRNLFLLAKHLHPDLSSIDGLVGMQGNGPVTGTPIDVGVGLAGQDSIAVDATAARIMGINPEDVGYLYYCAKAGLGTLNPELDSELKAKKFQLHDSVDRQFQWH
jgi:uncharacterized protein (DUF362 family)